MVRLEDLTRGAAVKGILPDGLVTVVDVKWHGSAVELTYKDASGHLGSELLCRDREPTLEIAAVGCPRSLDADGVLLRLVSEAHRFHLAYVFDPLLAVHTRLVTPLPHQITAVYGEMLPRQPLSFLLADDPGAGKTIMAGLFLIADNVGLGKTIEAGLVARELILGDRVRTILIVCPSSIQIQRRGEMRDKFGVEFRIVDSDLLRELRWRRGIHANPWPPFPRLIASIDFLKWGRSVVTYFAMYEHDSCQPA